ncbi:nucleoside-diphosphate kinase [Synchytrium microbalum]|uniref:Nucleoside diphosphate kinase n=1 Tax=Synchytrium microbalum TaxID=1806994 RepID=A0A507BSK2_9FUNG|nr:nucleoside-diphosphate kinase [Synchytrium microbalum]TPX32047.1 nucleoside-diphosphate kinase [Synchytrium microbalum]
MHYLTSVPKEIANNPRALKYRRRVLNPRTFQLSPAFRMFRVGAWTTTACAMTWLVLFADWGDGYHSLTPVRNAYARQRDWFFGLTEDDIEEDIMESFPSLPVSSQSIKAPLFELLSLSNKLTFDNVYVNGLHALRRCEIRNTSDSTIIVKLRSNLGNQIAFQVTNENLPDYDDQPTSNIILSDRIPRTSASSIDSVAEDDGVHRNLPSKPRSRASSFSNPRISSTSGDKSVDKILIDKLNLSAEPSVNVNLSLQTPYSQQFNQLFNYVNHIDEVTIEPGMKQKIIIAFLPESKVKTRRRTEKPETEAFMAGQDENVAGEESFDFFEVNGMLFFFGYTQKAPDASHAITEWIPPMVVDLETPVLPSPAMSRVIMSSNNSKPTSPVDDGALNVISPPDYQCTVKFKSRVCRSVLWTDVSEIVFEDSVVGGTYFKDFTLWNRSEIDLYWNLNMVEVPNAKSVQLLDCDTGELLDTKPISSFSHRRIRVAFRPLQPGDFGLELQLENLNDAANLIPIFVHAMVRTVVNEELLVVSTGTSLDFGDCLAGTWCKQQLVLRNISESNLDVEFSSDYADVIFQLKVDDVEHSDSQQNDNDTVEPIREIDNHVAESDEESNSDSSPQSSPTLKPSTLKSNEMSHSSSLDVLEMFQAQSGTAEISPDISAPNQTDELTYIEEMVLKPGSERIVEVFYKPQKDNFTPDFRGGRLTRRSFRIFLTYTVLGSSTPEKKTIQCKARTCTSFIDVSPHEVTFGDTDVGTLKSCPLLITNVADLNARIELRFISKVLNTYRDELVIPPRQSVEVKVDIYPRKVNPDYSKQITVVNLTNRDNDQVVEVRSNNIDKNRVTFHSLFYRILTPSNTNFIDFGGLVLNAPAVRTFILDNISAKPLVLELSTSMSEEMLLFVKTDTLVGRDSEATPSLQRREKLLDMSNRKLDSDTANGTKSSESPATDLEDSENSAQSPTTAPPRLRSQMPSERLEATERTQYLDLASTVSDKRSPRRRGTGRTSTVAVPHRNLSRDRENREYVPDATITLDTKLSGEDERSRPSRLPDQGRPSRNGLLSNGNNYISVNVTASNSNNAEGEEVESRMPVSKLITSLETTTGVSPPLFPKISAEEKFVRAQLLLRRELELAVSENRLVPAKRVLIQPQSQLMVVVVFTPLSTNRPMVQSKPRKFDGRVFMKLVEFDRSIRQPQFEALLQGESIPVREFLVRCSICRSVMELGQKHINFGTLVKNERRTKTIVIRNNSEIHLLYAIRKSGTVASGDVIIGEGRFGILRSLAQKEVEFVFDPSLSGAFQERLKVENVMDHTNDQLLSLKAQIRKPSNFFLQAMTIDFGACLIDNESLQPQSIVVSNTSSKQSRLMEVRVELADTVYKYFDLRVRFEAVSNGDVGDQDSIDENRARRVVLSKASEEKLEQLEQKLKIATRKGRPEKIRKLADQIDRLKSGLDDNLFDTDNATSSVSEALTGSPIPSQVPTPTTEPFFSPPTQANSTLGSNDNISITSRDAVDARVSAVSFTRIAAIPPRPRIRVTDHSIIFPLDPREVQTVLVRITPVKRQSPHITDLDEPTGSESLSCRILVHEHRNTDSLKVLKLKAVVCYDQASYIDESSRLRIGNSHDDDTPNLDAPDLSTRGSSWVRFSEGSDIQKSDSPSESKPELSSVSDSRSKLTESATNTQSVSGISQGGNGSIITHDRALTSSPVQHTESSVLTSPAGSTPVVDQQSIRLIVELPFIDLGRVEEGIRRDCYFTLVNPHKLPVDYVLSKDAEALVLPAVMGRIEGSQSKRIDLSILSSKLGRQSWSLSVNFFHDVETVTFSAYVTAKEYVRFPSLGNLDNTGAWDLGDCFVDPTKKYAKVLGLITENVTNQDIAVTATSNLAQQCLIFADQALETPVVEFMLRQKSTTTFYVALQPYVSRRPTEKAVLSTASSTPNTTPSTPSTQDRPLEPGDRSKDGSRVRLSADESRNLVGGLRFIVQTRETNESMLTLLTQTIKFTALIGQSLFNVSETLVDFGRTCRLKDKYEKTLRLYNISHRLPLVCNVSSSSLNLRTSSATVYVPRSENASSVEFTIKLDAQLNGFIEESLTIVNANNTSQVVVVKVRLFVDPSIVLVSQNLIEWNEVYVGPPFPDVLGSSANGVIGLMKPKSSDIIPSYEQSFELENLSDELIEILPRSDLKIHVRWVVTRRAGFVISRNPTGVDGKVEDDVNDDEMQLVAYEQQTDVEPDILDANDGNLAIEGLVGPHLLLHPRQRAIGFVTVPQPSNIVLDSEDPGHFVTCDGYLILDHAERRTSLQLIQLRARYCQSIGDIHPSVIDLKTVRIGDRVKFSFSATNQADIPLAFELWLPSCIEIEGDFRIVDQSDEDSQHIILCPNSSIPPRSVQMIEALFIGKKNIPRNNQAYSIEFHNLFNAKNVLTVDISATLASFELRFDRLSNGELVLPALTHPSTTSSPSACDAWFSITNPGEDEVKFEVGVNVVSEFSHLVRIEVLSRSTNSPLDTGAITLGANSSIDVRVRAFACESRLSTNDSRSMDEGGQVWAEVLIDAERIPIRGRLVEGPSFTLSESRLVFNPRKLKETNQSSVTIANLLSLLPLRFQIKIEFPMEIPADTELIRVAPLDANMCGVVEASSKLAISIELMYSDIAALSEDIKLLVIDVDAVLRPPQIILLAIAEPEDLVEVNSPRIQAQEGSIVEAVALQDMSAAESGEERESFWDAQSTASASSAESAESVELVETETPRMPENSPRPADAVTATLLAPNSVRRDRKLPVFLLKGCKRVDDNVNNLYELELGQQDLSTTSINRKIGLENVSSERVSFRLKLLTNSDLAWLSFNRAEGVLDPGPQETPYPITLNMTAATRGTYTTYLTIENIDNPSDSKLVRISMEVVPRQNIRRTPALPSATTGSNVPSTEPISHVFDVLVNGVDAEQTHIEMDNLYYEADYVARSMVIYNRESVPLQFTVTSNVAFDEPSELVFSISRTGARLFRKLVVEPESHVRVFVRYRPSKGSDYWNSKSSGSLSLRDATRPDERNMEVYVNCRLVKDYQKIVAVKAVVRHPQISLSTSSLLFTGTVKPTENGLVVDVQPESASIVLSNLLADDMEFAVINDTAYFDIKSLDAPMGSISDSVQITGLMGIIAPGQSTRLAISINRDALLRHADTLRKDKYVVEHLNIYNRRRPSEKYWLVLKLSFGHIRDFEMASGSKRAFSTIEQHVANFLRYATKDSSLLSVNEVEDQLVGSQHTTAQDLHFLYIYVVDQLIHFGTREHASEAYMRLAHLLFSGPVVTLLLRGENLIDGLKKLVGPIAAAVDKSIASKSLRSKYSTSASTDGFHSSDSKAMADREVRFFFPEAVVDPLPETENVQAFLEDSLYPVLTKGLTQLCKEKPENPTAWLGQWLLENNPNKPQVTEPESD